MRRLVPCRTCRRHVADSALVCPFCARPLLALAALTLVASCSRGDPEAAVAAAEASARAATSAQAAALASTIASAQAEERRLREALEEQRQRRELERSPAAVYGGPPPRPSPGTAPAPCRCDRKDPLCDCL